MACRLRNGHQRAALDKKKTTQAGEGGKIPVVTALYQDFQSQESLKMELEGD